MASSLHIDFETRSALDLKKVGLHRYVNHPSTDVWCMAWAVDDDEPAIWTPDTPGDFAKAYDFVYHGRAHDDCKIVAHNAPFEMAIWKNICVPRYGFPVPDSDAMWCCTMAMAYAMGLPGALEDAALALGLDVRKDMDGRAIMLRFARPWKTDADGTHHWMDECPEFTIGGQKMTGPQALAKLFTYCQQDVRVERELEKRLLPLSAKERKVWLMDYAINQRGVAVDLETTTAAMKIAETVKEKAGEDIARITDGAVQSISALAALKDWMATRGVPISSLAKQEVVDLLDTSLPDDVRAALVVRQEVGKASTAKLDRIIDSAGDDGRLRNLYQYHGAGSGRWAGRGVQVHNLPRDMPKADVVERILALVREGNHEALDMIYGAPVSVISRCLRGLFVAPPGKVLISGDWANVEGRGAAWFAGEQWKIDAFNAADNKTGPGLYELAYSRMFNVPVESVKDPSEERQIGKVSELAFQYQGGVGSFRTMAKSYPDMHVQEMSDEKINGFKEAWRDGHPKIAGVRTQGRRADGEVFWFRKGGIWKEIQEAAIGAVENPGLPFTVGVTGREAVFKTAGSFLWCRLPSARVICFPYPKVLQGEYGPVLTYMAVPDPNKPEKIIHDECNANNWARHATYGGALFNRIVQGFCRDFLADCMLELHEAGASIVIHTHDDINIEVDEAKSERAREGMELLMRKPPAWAKGFPLFAKCKIMKRYGK